ncbi:MAG: hypothetical protein J07HN6_01055, partial [Halonotius sp. J07HN6]
ERNVLVTHPRYENTSRTVSISTTNSPVNEQFTLTRTTGQLTGTVEADASPPINESVSGVTVEVDHASAAADNIIESPALSSTVTTGAGGTYSIEVPTGDVTLIVDSDGYKRNATSVNNIDSGGATQDITLTEQIGKIEGSVTNEDGEDIKGATVSIEPQQGRFPGLTRSDLSNKTDSSGNYTIPEVPETATGVERTVSVVAPTFQSEQKSTAVDGTETLDFTLDHTTGSLTGTVTNAQGTPLNGVTVTIAGKTTTTDTDGSYAIDDLPFGSHNMTVGHSDYKDVTRTGVRIEEDTETQEDFSLNRDTPVRLKINDV